MSARPLPMGPRVFYRVHDRQRPWTMRDAWSAPVSFPYSERTKEYEPKWDRSRKQKGYSCFPDPWHLLHYVYVQGWDDSVKERMDVYQFTGTPTGEKGPDGEPLVIPDFKVQPRPTVITWATFMERIKVTPRGAAPTWQGLAMLPRDPSDWDRDARDLLMGKMPGLRSDRLVRDGFITCYIGTSKEHWDHDKARGRISRFTKDDGDRAMVAASRRFGFTVQQIRDGFNDDYPEDWFAKHSGREMTTTKSRALGDAQAGHGWLSWLASAIVGCAKEVYREQVEDKIQWSLRGSDAKRDKAFEKWFVERTGLPSSDWMVIRVHLVRDLGWTPVLLTLKVPKGEVTNYPPPRNETLLDIEVKGEPLVKWVTDARELPVLWERWSARRPTEPGVDLEVARHAPSSVTPLAAGHRPGGVPVTATMLRPLLMGAGVFYRVHPKGKPFSPEHATSRVFGYDDLPVDIQRIVTPVKGYSAFGNPLNLLQYAHQMGWDDQTDQYGLPYVSDPVVRFEGERVGEGFDGEPVVRPTSGILETIDWADFRDRIEVTRGAIPGVEGSAREAASSRAGIEVENFHPRGRTWAGVVASDRGPQLAYRGFGSWEEAREAVTTGHWRSSGMFVVEGEGETQVALSLGDVLRGSGFHQLRGTGFLGAVEMDVAGLPFQTFIQPVDPRPDGTALLKPDLGLGIGIDKGIPVARIRRIFRIENNRVAQTWTLQDFRLALDALEDNPEWMPEVYGRPETQRFWAGWDVKGAKNMVHRLLDDDQHTTYCGRQGLPFNSKGLVPFALIQQNKVTTDVASLRPEYKEKPPRRLPPCSVCFPDRQSPWRGRPKPVKSRERGYALAAGHRPGGVPVTAAGVSATAAGEQWLINGKPYSDGVWIEVRPDHWYRGAAAVRGEIPSRLFVKREGDSWVWQAQVTTFIGAPHENTGWQKTKAPTGKAKTLEQAKAKAEVSLTKDHEFFRRYVERQDARLRRTAAEDYWGHHRAPLSTDDVAAPLHDVEEMMPDYYARPGLYRHDGGPADAECARVIRSARGKPEAMVTVYRALPPGYTTINSGDWVTISKTYAKGHAMQTDDPAEDWPVIAAQVPARTLWTEGYAAEWGYSGPRVTGRTAGLVRTAIALETAISVAEKRVEETGRGGRTWHFPRMHTDDPGWAAAHDPAERFVREVLASEGVTDLTIRVYLATYGMEGTVAATDGYNYIQVSRERVSTLTLLHECAHIVNGTQEGRGHDAAFVKVATRLYERYLPAGAAELFAGIATMGLPRAHGHRTGGVPAVTAIRKRAEADQSGVMVCLKPSEAMLDTLTGMDECTEDREQLHLTLLYLGSTEEAGGPYGRERLYRACYDFAIHSGRTLTARLNGFGAFLNGDENVLIGLWDIPGIAEFRTDLMRACASHGVSREDNHGFTPHTTLAYLDGPPEGFPKLPGDLAEEEFGSLWIAWGDEPWQEVGLSLTQQAG